MKVRILRALDDWEDEKGKGFWWRKGWIFEEKFNYPENFFPQPHAEMVGCVGMGLPLTYLDFDKKHFEELEPIEHKETKYYEWFMKYHAIDAIKRKKELEQELYEINLLLEEVL